MNDVIINSVVTMLSVVIGGLIAIFTGDLVNRRMLKKEHSLDLLKKVKELLSEWSTDILLGGIEFTECLSIDKYKGYQLSLSARALITTFETNSSVLEIFKNEFTEIRKKDLLRQLKDEEYTKTLIALSEKYNTKNTLLLLEFKDVNEILEEQSLLIMEIYEKIWSLIAKIDNHIADKIL